MCSDAHIRVPRPSWPCFFVLGTVRKKARPTRPWHTIRVNGPHRKTRRIFDHPGHAHFLTYSCQQRLPLLDSDRTRQWVIEAMAVTRDRLGIRIGAYVIMPEHVHVLVRCPEGISVSVVLGSLKKPVSARAKAWLAEHDPGWVERLTVEKGNRRVFRFWQAGGGFDRNIWKQRTLEDVIEYIHANPVRRGLVERPTDWEWSSARYWAGMDGVLEMDRIG